MNDTDQLPRQLRLLKALVIGLGVLLGIAAIVVVFAALSKLSEKPRPSALSDAASPGAAASLASFGISELPLPEDCQVQSVSAAGDRVVMLIDGSDDCHRVLVADLKTGKLLGQFQFPVSP